MTASANLRPSQASVATVALPEIRHFQPGDSLHCEPLSVRGQLHGGAIPAHRHDDLHQLLWLAHGELTLRLNARTWTLQAPALALIAPGDVHTCRHGPQTLGWQLSVDSRWLATLLHDAAPLRAGLGQTQVLLADQLPATDVSCLEAGLVDLHTELAGQAAGRATVITALLQLLFTRVLRHIVRSAPAQPQPRPGLRDTLVRRYQALLEQAPSDRQGLARYAAQLQVSPDHLSRCCRAVTGLSALQLLHQRVTLHAQRRLLDPSRNVSDVARELGFEDVAYFSRFFTRRTGRSPQAWRNAAAEGRLMPA